MSALNPHQFGDQGTLFEAPSGVPSSGVHLGNPHARIYRSLRLPRGHSEDPHEILKTAGKNRQTEGVQVNLGIHWQHDLDYAQEYQRGDGHRGREVILEADHPGQEHVAHDFFPERVKTEEDDVLPGLANYPRGRFGTPSREAYRAESGPTDQDIYQRTIHYASNPEIPVRPGAPMSVRAVHLKDADWDSWERHEVNHRGQA